MNLTLHYSALHDVSQLWDCEYTWTNWTMYRAVKGKMDKSSMQWDEVPSSSSLIDGNEAVQHGASPVLRGRDEGNLDLIEPQDAPKSASDDSFEDGIGFPVKHMWENVYARMQYCSDKISQLPIWNMSPSWTEFAAQQERPEDVCAEIYGAGQNLSGENMNTDGKVSLGTLHCSDVRKFETSTMLDGAFHSIVCDTASGSGEFASNNWKAS